MKAATLHAVIDEKLKYCILMESGIEDGYHHFETEKWSVQFYDDNKTTEVNFPNDEVRVLN